MPLFPLSGSVGNGGDNNPADVLKVQQAMTAAAIFAPGLLEPGEVDGICGPGTKGDISDLQRFICHTATPDARIDVGGKTHRTLSACASIAAEPWTFPYDAPATAAYHGRGAGQRAFRFRRSGGARSHAGVDLYAPEGREVRAVADGVVHSVNAYYLGTWVVTITHTAHDGHRYVCRYGEVSPNVPVRAGDTVLAGEVVGYVGDLEGLNLSMTHFETYLFADDPKAFKQTGRSSARDRVNNRPFVRRGDIVDSTGMLHRAPYPTNG